MEGKLFATTIKTLAPQFQCKSKPSIDNIVFKLHYKATVALLVVFVLLVCSREFFGNHIKCITEFKDKDIIKVIETYCFFMSTFTVIRNYDGNIIQSESLPHPGVGPMRDNDEILHHTYYQWVPFVLFLQSIAFYMPHYIWKKIEGGRVKALVDGLQHTMVINDGNDLTVKDKKVLSKKTLDKKLRAIRKNIILRLRISRTWSVWMVILEIVNLLNANLQIYIVNCFLRGQFLELGLKVVEFTNWNNKTLADPLEVLFPQVTKCTFHKFGSGGTLQKHDALCVMALNIIHKKIYVILWFWFLFLVIMSVLALIWRFVSLFLYRRSLKFNEIMFRHATGDRFSSYKIFSVINGCQYIDWLFLYYLAKNMHGCVFRELFSGLAEELQLREVGVEQKEKKPALIERIKYDDEIPPVKTKTANL